MKILNVTVGNFKNVAETTIHFSKITALLSVNNYGKSNLLEAIQFGLDFITASPKARNSYMKKRQYIPLVPSLAGKDFQFSIEFDAPELGIYRYVKYSYRFAWYNDRKTGAVITDENLEIREKDKGRYTSYLNREKGTYRAGKNKLGTRKISMAKDMLAVDILSALPDIDIAAIVEKIKLLHYHVFNTRETSYDSDPIEAGTDHIRLPFDDEDITRALNKLNQDFPEQYDLFLEEIYSLFPEFSDIRLYSYPTSDIYPMLNSERKDEDHASESIPYRVKDELFRLMITDKYINQPINIQLMSTGTKRIIWLIANTFFANNYGLNLIGVDEIELSLHPKLIKQVLETIDDNLGDASMLLTSHSPYLVQYLKPESVYIGVPNDQGTAVFRKIAPSKIKSLQKTSREMGESFGEYLFSLMAGDRDSLRILNAYLEE